MAENKQTATTKLTNKVTVGGHGLHIRKRVGAIQQGKNVDRVLSATIKQVTSALVARKGVHFDSNVRIRTYHNNNDPVMVTYDSGADGNYVSGEDRLKAGMPILQKSTKRVGVANAGTCQGKWETKLPLPQLSKKTANPDSFDKFPRSLMSVVKTNDNGNVSIFTKDGVTVHKEEDVLIT